MNISREYLIPGAFSPGTGGRGREADLSGELQLVSKLRLIQIARACLGVLLNSAHANLYRLRLTIHLQSYVPVQATE